MYSSTFNGLSHDPDNLHESVPLRPSEDQNDNGMSVVPQSASRSPPHLENGWRPAQPEFDGLRSDQIEPDSWYSAHPASDALQSDEFNSNALPSEQFNSDSLLSDQLNSNGLRSVQLNSDGLCSDLLNSDGLQTDQQISDGSDQMNSNAWQSDQLESEALRSDQLNSDALPSDHLNSDAWRSDQLECDGSRSDQLDCDGLHSAHIESEGWHSDHLESDWSGVAVIGSAAPEERASPKLKSRSCDDLLSDEPGRPEEHQVRSESTGSLLHASQQLNGHCDIVLSPELLQERARQRSAHDAPGFLKLYRRMHHIDRRDMIKSEVICSVKTRIHEYERVQHMDRLPHALHGNNDVPQNMVPNRISQFEMMIQKSKSMPNLEAEGRSQPPSRKSTSPSPRRSFSTDFFLDEDPPARNPPEGRPQCHRANALPPQPPLPPLPTPVQIHITPDRMHLPISIPATATNTPVSVAANHDCSDSEHDAVVSDLSDFIQVEGSSLCSESDFDHCSYASSESFYAPPPPSNIHHHHHSLNHHHTNANHHHHSSNRHHNHHHHHHQYVQHHHRQLVSTCKGHCPASYTRFTTMLKHERAKQDQQRQLRPEDADTALDKLAFLVSPVPFRRKKNSSSAMSSPGFPLSRVQRSKSSVYEALDSALKDIYDHIQAEKRRGSLPDDSILNRLLAELLPDIPDRHSSLVALETASLETRHQHQQHHQHRNHQHNHNHSHNHHSQPDGMDWCQAEVSQRVPRSSSCHARTERNHGGSGGRQEGLFFLNGTEHGYEGGAEINGQNIYYLLHHLPPIVNCDSDLKPTFLHLFFLSSFLVFEHVFLW